MTYFRDSNNKEIDLLIEENNRIHQLEIKKSANPDSREVKKFSVLEKTIPELSAGSVFQSNGFSLILLNLMLMNGNLYVRHKLPVSQRKLVYQRIRD